MKKTLIIFMLLFAILFSFSVAYTQQDDYNFYYDLIGKNREYINKYFPDAEVIPFYSDILAGFTELGAVQFDNGATVSVCVSYNTNKNVKSVALVMFNMIKTNAPSAIYDALDYFSYFYGFKTHGLNSKDIKVTHEEEYRIVMTIADEIKYTVKRRYKNFEQYFIAEAEFIGKW